MGKFTKIPRIRSKKPKARGQSPWQFLLTLAAWLADTHQGWWTYKSLASPCALMCLLVNKNICTLSWVYSVCRMSFRMAKDIRRRWHGMETLPIPHNCNLSLSMLDKDYRYYRNKCLCYIEVTLLLAALSQNTQMQKISSKFKLRHTNVLCLYTQKKFDIQV